MARAALIVWGGWDGHEPQKVAELFAEILREDGFSVHLSDTLDAFKNLQNIQSLKLIVPVWTMGKITDAQVNPVLDAVKSGVGMAGCHGGMCDAFRENTDWQFMTGGQWVAHPGNDGLKYDVRITPQKSEITAGISDFSVASEQYYMHVDPAVKVLATTQFPIADGPHVPNGVVEMPVIWAKFFGRGRVFYNSLGHQTNVLAVEPVKTLMRRGFRWAAAE